MRIFELGDGNAASSRTFGKTTENDRTLRQLSSRIPTQKAYAIRFLTSRHREFGGSLSIRQLQRFIDEWWDRMQADGLEWKPSASTLRRAIKFAEAVTCDLD